MGFKWCVVIKGKGSFILLSTYAEITFCQKAKRTTTTTRFQAYNRDAELSTLAMFSKSLVS